MESIKYVLSEKDIPTRWYNIQADLPVPLPPYLHPATKQPLGPVANPGAARAVSSHLRCLGDTTRGTG